MLEVSFFGRGLKMVPGKCQDNDPDHAEQDGAVF